MPQIASSTSAISTGYEEQIGLQLQTFLAEFYLFLYLHYATES